MRDEGRVRVGVAPRGGDVVATRDQDKMSICVCMSGELRRWRVGDAVQNGYPVKLPAQC
jgi:hypothetical protein